MLRKAAAFFPSVFGVWFWDLACHLHYLVKLDNFGVQKKTPTHHTFRPAVQSITFDFDWADLTSEQGTEIIRKVEGMGANVGFGQHGVEDPDPTYVITVDNSA